MKKEKRKKSNTGIVIFEIILYFGKKKKKVCTYIHLPPDGISFYLRIPKNSFMFNFSKTNAHIFITEYVLSVYCDKCIICNGT